MSQTQLPIDSVSEETPALCSDYSDELPLYERQLVALLAKALREHEQRKSKGVNA